MRQITHLRTKMSRPFLRCSTRPITISHRRKGRACFRTVWLDAALGLRGSHRRDAFRGFVKGAVGFAMPLDHDLGAVALHRPAWRSPGSSCPIVMSNFLQAIRFGWPEMKATREYWRYILIVCVRHRHRRAIRDQRADADLLPDPRRSCRGPVGHPACWACGFTSPRGDAGWRNGSSGLSRGRWAGLTGTWGPPTVLYLIALETPKAKQLLVQGVVYGLGSISLLAGHVQSGVLNLTTLPFSAAF
jgi:hypothetical protein